MSIRLCPISKVLFTTSAMLSFTDFAFHLRCNAYSRNGTLLLKTSPIRTNLKLESSGGVRILDRYGTQSESLQKCSFCSQRYQTDNFQLFKWLCSCFDAVEERHAYVWCGTNRGWVGMNGRLPNPKVRARLVKAADFDRAVDSRGWSNAVWVDEDSPEMSRTDAHLKTPTVLFNMQCLQREWNVIVDDVPNPNQFETRKQWRCQDSW